MKSQLNKQTNEIEEIFSEYNIEQLKITSPHVQKDINYLVNEIRQFALISMDNYKISELKDRKYELVISNTDKQLKLQGTKYSKYLYDIRFMEYNNSADDLEYKMNINPYEYKEKENYQGGSRFVKRDRLKLGSSERITKIQYNNKNEELKLESSKILQKDIKNSGFLKKIKNRVIKTLENITNKKFENISTYDGNIIEKKFFVDKIIPKDSNYKHLSMAKEQIISNSRNGDLNRLTRSSKIEAYYQKINYIDESYDATKIVGMDENGNIIKLCNRTFNNTTREVMEKDNKKVIKTLIDKSYNTKIIRREEIVDGVKTKTKEEIKQLGGI